MGDCYPRCATWLRTACTQAAEPDSLVCGSHHDHGCPRAHWRADGDEECDCTGDLPEEDDHG